MANNETIVTIAKPIAIQRRATRCEVLEGSGLACIFREFRLWRVMRRHYATHLNVYKWGGSCPAALRRQGLSADIGQCSRLFPDLGRSFPGLTPTIDANGRFTLADVPCSAHSTLWR
jgi:hypothetical protein